MRRLQVRYHASPGQVLAVGDLAEDRGRFFFEYDAAFVARGFPLSPFKLPAIPGLQTFQCLPGVFDDALPDGWGRLLMDRFFRQKGGAPAAFTELDRLAWMGTHAMGALSFHPPSQELAEGVPGFELGRLAREAQAVLEGEAGVVLPELLQAGGSPGGARPKVLAGVCGGGVAAGPEPYPAGYEPWLVKFFAKADPPDTGAVEEAYACMAQAAGIAFPGHRLFEVREGRFFGVRRFDREGGRRIHMHSLGNLVGADFRVPCLDYQDIHKVVRLLTGDQAEVQRAYRLMLFNVLAHNRDDHAKNFSFLYTPDAGWRLAPGFDLTFAEGPGGEHTTSVAGEGRAPGRAHFRRVAQAAGIGEEDAGRIEEEVRAAVGRWPVFARACGVRKPVWERIGKRVAADGKGSF
ncbi:MAG: type II toxin-antitoxin system HipA family toxin [bacterium]